MSTQAPDTRVRPSALWYLLVVGLWVASFIIAVIAFKPIVEIFRDGITYVNNGQRVVVPEGGLTVYSTRSDRSIECALVDQDAISTPLEPFDENAEFDFDPGEGPRVWALATTPDDLAAGTYLLACEALPRDVFATGNKIDVAELGGRFLAGILIPGVLGLVGLIVLIVLLVKRHNAKTRIRQLQSSGWSGGGYGGTTPYGGGTPYGGTPYGDTPQQGGGYEPPSGYQPPAAPTSPQAYPAPGSTPPPPPPPPPGSYPPPDVPEEK